MKQLLLLRWYAGEARISLSGDDYRYPARVLRLREGAKVPAVDHHGSRYLMRIAAIGPSACQVEISPSQPELADPEGRGAGEGTGAARPLHLTLLQCLPKGRKIDLIIRQARLSRIAREALQQSGNPRLPAVEAPRSFASLAEAPGVWGTALFFHEERLSGSSLHELLAEPVDRVSMLVGPEGGLSPTEVGLLASAGFRPVYLGDAVLRVETAAIDAIAAVRTILQERDAWRAEQRR